MVKNKKYFPILFLVTILIAATTAYAEDLERGGYVLKPFSKEFQRLAEIAGLWKGKKKDAQGEADVQVEYRLTSGNSALVERLFKDSPEEMVSVYHDDGESILMTHFCGLGNQPRMRAKSIEGGKLRFQFLDGSNMKSNKETHMHALTIKLLDDDRMIHEWELHGDGKKQQTVVITLSRVK